MQTQIRTRFGLTVCLAALQAPALGEPGWPGLEALREHLRRFALVERIEEWCGQRADWAAITRARLRLSLHEYTLRDPLRAPELALGLSDRLVEASRRRLELAEILAEAARLLDLAYEPATLPEALLQAATPFGQRMDLLEQVLVSACAAAAEATSALDPEQRAELARDLPLLLRDMCQSAQILDRPEHAATLERIERVRRDSLLRAAQLVAPLATERFGRSLYDSFARERPPKPARDERPPGVEGTVLWARSTSAGWMLIGSGGSNAYDTPILFLLDIGGDDRYAARATRADLEQPLNVVIDLEGADRYQSLDGPGAGAGLLGVSMVVDHAGDDEYRGEHVAQGAALAGIGILIDHEGRDELALDSLGQGAAIYGIGLHVDRGGDDRTRASFAAQGFGGPGGLGLLLDTRGDDRRHAGGKYPSAVLAPGEFSAWSMGVGLGLRGAEQEAPQAAGGVGLLIDADGSDVYEVGEFGFGTGSYLGIGIVRELEGDDRVHASRFGIASAAHLGLGIVLDDSGNDLWSNPHTMSCGAAWDLGLAFLLDAAGDDRYVADGIGPASATITSLAALVDAGGRDEYSASGIFAFGNGGHELDVTRRTKSLSFFLDLGGAQDVYPESPLRPRPSNGEQTLRRQVGSVDGLTKETGVGMFVDR